jgi:hypothetical protein
MFESLFPFNYSLCLLLLQVHDLVELAWALAQWETPMPPNWAKVCDALPVHLHWLHHAQLVHAQQASSRVP